MKKASGFTLIELILTLVLTAILAGIVVEIIAGPIRSYFWVAQQAFKVENAELTISTLARDLNMALPQTVQMESGEGQHLEFRKILFEGLIIPSEKNTTRLLAVLGKFGDSLDVNKSYALYFPMQGSKENKFYNTQIKDTALNGELILHDDLPNVVAKPSPFYLLSNPIHIECNNNEHKLERIEDENIALINDAIQSCHFSPFTQNHFQGVIVSIAMGIKKEGSIKFTQPILFEKNP